MNGKGLIFIYKIRPLCMAPRARLSAKLFSVPFRILDDSYKEKYTYNILFYLQNIKNG